jgi:hypothetical protein
MREHKALSTKELAELIDLSPMVVRTKMIDLVIRGSVVEIKPVPRETIAAVRAEEDFVELLLREIEWPIPMSVQRLAEVATPHNFVLISEEKLCKEWGTGKIPPADFGCPYLCSSVCVERAQRAGGEFSCLEWQNAPS